MTDPDRLTPTTPPRPIRPAPSPRADAVWAAARARNALRRKRRIGFIATLFALGALAFLIFVPQQAQRVARESLPDPTEWRDTVPVMDSLSGTQALLGAALREFAGARDSAVLQAQLASAPAPALPPEQVARRDALTRVAAELERGLERAVRAPLLASYRALGETAALRTSTQTRALLDSLAEVEREREAFGTVSGVDPIYVSLTSRASDLGRQIQALGSAALASARGELEQLRAVPRVAPNPLLALPPVDTLAPLARVAAAREQVRLSLEALERTRTANQDYVRRVAEVRRRESVAAPPAAVVAAALILGLVAGYALVFGAEVMRPRVGSVAEAERLAGARVLAVVGLFTRTPERDRRRADEHRAGLVQPGSETYRLLYLHLSATGAALPMVTVTGGDATVAGTVAVNLAAAAAAEARSTLLVDLDTTSAVASRILRIPLDPGLTDIRAGSLAWPEAVTTIPIGRDRALDMITSGRPPRSSWRRGADEPETVPVDAEELRRGLARMTRRYDLTVLVAAAERIGDGEGGLVAMPEVIICARVAFTTHRSLADTVDAVRDAGLRVAGVVLWMGPAPSIPAAVPGRRQRRWEGALAGAGT